MNEQENDLNARTYAVGIHATDARPQAQNSAQTEAQADRLKLAALLDQTIDAIPANTDPAERSGVAATLVSETLASAKRLGLLPVAGQITALTNCRAALRTLPDFLALPEFQAAAKAALRAVITAENESE